MSQQGNTFRSIDEFYTANTDRAHSGELDFGVYWTERPRETWPNHRISFIRDTREFYAYNHHDRSVELLGSLPPSDTHDAYDLADAVMLGWAEQIHRGGLPWAREHIRTACAQAWREAEERVS